MALSDCLTPETLGYLKELAQNNDRNWFADNKARYLAAREDFEGFVAALLDEMIEVDPDLQGLKPGACIFRIYRDIRFSKSKLPYKAHFGAAMGKNGRKSPFPNYYIHIQPGASFLGGGIYHPTAKVLKTIRQEIDYNLEEFEQILDEKSFQEHFQMLKGAQLKIGPRGYSAQNRALKYLKFKDFIVTHQLDDVQVTEKGFKTYVVEKFKVMKNFMNFLKMPIFDIA